MSIKSRLVKLEARNPKADYSKLTSDERRARIKFLMAESREWGCPNCNPCPTPDRCARIEELNNQLRLMDE